MRSASVITLKSDLTFVWIAVLDSASGKHGRYTVYRAHRGADKRADIVGREVDLRTARKLAGERTSDGDMGSPSSFDHACDWRRAALMLAKCVSATLQADGKIGVGSGLVMKIVDGERMVERWDKDFIEALAFIGIGVVDVKRKPSTKTTKLTSKKRPQPKDTAR